MAPITIPDPALVSPGTLGVRFIQDDWRAVFDRRNKLLLMEGRRPDAVFIGDSLTADWPVNESFGDLFPVCLNRGIGGDQAAHVHLRLEADALQLQPRNLFFMIGTNDIAARFGYDSDDKILADLERHYRTSFSLMRGRTKAYIGAVPPTRAFWINDQMFPRKRVLVPAANAVLRRLAAEFGFGFIDYCAPLEESEGVLRAEYTNDGCHFVASGYYVLDRTVREAMHRDPPAR
jgi:lysophospholipase L1-like esterase